MFRVQAKRDTNIVTGGALLRARESGTSLLKANQKRKSLLEKVNSSDPDVAVKALQNAQASGRRSPVISTTLSKKKAKAALKKFKSKGVNAELITIKGPKDKGIDLEQSFKDLGGRTKNKQLEEFGIPDLFFPSKGKSKSGFEILKRE